MSRKKIQELHEVCNLDYLLMEFDHFGLLQRQILLNLANFATMVMPRFGDQVARSFHFLI